jgi:chaperonin cofactor prefoldin
MDDAEVGRLLGEVAVSYSVKELLSRIEDKVTRLDTKFENVATTAQVTALEVKVEQSIDTLEKKVDNLESVRDRMIGAAFAVGALAGGGAGWIANLLASR